MNRVKQQTHAYLLLFRRRQVMVKVDRAHRIRFEFGTLSSNTCEQLADSADSFIQHVAGDCAV
jgi:hypothetical protein